MRCYQEGTLLDLGTYVYMMLVSSRYSQHAGLTVVYHHACDLIDAERECTVAHSMFLFKQRYLVLCSALLP
jgi:hypothetical protein